VKADDFATWWFTIEVMGESLYPVSQHISLVRSDPNDTPQGEVYTLQFRFDSSYPISSPAVQFVVTDGKEAPVHPVCSVNLVLVDTLRSDPKGTIACLLKRPRACT
jgi:ubiquitin-conjugating enzyme E2 W